MQGMKYKDIAEKHDVSVNTVKSWKSRYKWDRTSVHTKEEKVRTQKKTGAPMGNQNALGNSGNKNPKWGNKNALGHGAPKGNHNAMTHGFFRKHFPEEVVDLMKEIATKDPLDMLWENIMIQYVAIVRAQRIMLVKHHNDMTKEIKKEKSSLSAEEVEYEIQFAWDKQATFLNAQFRAMSTLSSLIRDFDKLASIDDERRTKLSLINVQIDKIRNELKDENPAEDEDKIGQYLDRLEGAFKK